DRAHVAPRPCGGAWRARPSAGPESRATSRRRRSFSRPTTARSTRASGCRRTADCSSASVLSRENVKQLVRVARSQDGKENAHAHWPADPTPDRDDGRARGAGTMGPAPDDRPSPGAAGAADPRLGRRQDQHRGRARAAADPAPSSSGIFKRRGVPAALPLRFVEPRRAGPPLRTARVRRVAVERPASLSAGASGALALSYPAAPRAPGTLRNVTATHEVVRPVGMATGLLAPRLLVAALLAAAAVLVAPAVSAGSPDSVFLEEL